MEANGEGIPIREVTRFGCEGSAPHAAREDQNRTAPVPSNAYNPFRAGFMELSSTFGLKERELLG